MSKKLDNIKNTGFKTPKSYFDTLEDSVFAKLKTESLQSEVNDSGFTIPNNYLDGIEDNVMASLHSENTKVVSLFNRRNLLYVSGIAAAIIIAFGIFMKEETTDETELDYELVENYIIDQDISSYELAALLTEEELLEINTDIMDDTYTDESIEDYLLENVDLEDIIEQ